jgi:hypothetical protein
MKTILTNFRGEHAYILPAEIVLFLFLLASGLPGVSQVSINTTGNPPNVSAMLDITATGKGLLVPRMTYVQLPALPATGLLVYITDVTPGYYYYDGSAWKRIGLQLEQPWQFSGANIYYTADRVAVGVADPDSHGFMAKNYITGKSAVRGVNGSGASVFAEGQLGVLNTPGAIILPVNVSNIGVLGLKPALGGNGVAVYGWNNENNASNYAGLFAADGAATNQGANYGV